jgi:hypothetical protein
MISATLVIALAALLGLAIVSATALRLWQGWLALKHRELDYATRGAGATAPSGMGRIELADLRERIRKLEAIAAGVDL